MKIAVSVIIPVYNVDIYLPACLDSTLGQTLHNIEVICVNDRSPDTSRQILDTHAVRDSRIIILDHERNLGLAAARNTGLKHATGEYVFFLDSDDLLFSPDSLKLLYSIALQDDADEVIGATLRWYEQTGERLYEHHREYLREDLNGVLFKDHHCLRHNAIACNKMLKRSFLVEKNILFNSALRKFEDNVFSWKVHFQARAISLTRQATYLHRIRSDQAGPSIMQNRKKDVLYHTLAATDLLDYIETKPELNPIRHLIDRYFFSWCFIDVQQMKSQGLSGSRKKEILEQYLRVLSRVPASSLEGTAMPGRYREGLFLMQKGQFDKAWEVFAAENYQTLCLQKRLDAIYNSMSWKVTAPLRKTNKLLRKLKSR